MFSRLPLRMSGKKESNAEEPVAPGTPTSSSVLVAGIDVSSWPEVEVVVPPGPLGIVLDGNSSAVAVLDSFAPLATTGEKGVLEKRGDIVHGSVLVSVNQYDFLSSGLTLAEVSEILRETGHLRRKVRFKVPPPHPSSAVALEPIKVEKVRLAHQPSDAAHVDADTDQLLKKSEPSSSSAHLLDEMPSASLSPTSSSTVSSPPSSSRKSWTLQGLQGLLSPSIMSPFVNSNGPTTPTTHPPMVSSTIEPSTPPSGSRVVILEAPPGPLGLNLDGGIVDRAVVLGFIPLPDGSRGMLEKHGGIKPGSTLVRINGEDVSTASLAQIREKLGALSALPRKLQFHLPTKQAQVVSSKPERRLSNSTPTTKTIEDFDKRRRLELALIVKHDRTKLKYKECWFVIDAQWMSHWVTFAGKQGPEPGPITNEVLLEENWEKRLQGDEPGRADVSRQGLQLMKDYRCVSPMVWCLLKELHGSGEAPELARYVLDIYSEPLSQTEIDFVLHDVRPQAAALANQLLERSQVPVVD